MGFGRAYIAAARRELLYRWEKLRTLPSTVVARTMYWTFGFIGSEGNYASDKGTDKGRMTEGGRINDFDKNWNLAF